MHIVYDKIAIDTARRSPEKYNVWNFIKRLSNAFRLYHGFAPNFYRATRVRSADYAVARCLSVSLSVCLSDTCRFSVDTAEHILIIILPLGSPTVLVFPHQRGWQYANGNPLTRTSNAMEYKKLTIFYQYLALSRKWCKVEPLLLWLVYAVVVFSCLV